MQCHEQSVGVPISTIKHLISPVGVSTPGVVRDVSKATATTDKPGDDNEQSTSVPLKIASYTKDLPKGAEVPSRTKTLRLRWYLTRLPWDAPTLERTPTG